MSGKIIIDLVEETGEVTFVTEEETYSIVKFNSNIFEGSKQTATSTIALIGSYMTLLGECIAKVVNEPNLTIIVDDTDVDDMK